MQSQVTSDSESQYLALHLLRGLPEPRLFSFPGLITESSSPWVLYLVTSSYPFSNIWISPSTITSEHLTNVTQTLYRYTVHTDITIPVPGPLHHYPFVCHHLFVHFVTYIQLHRCFKSLMLKKKTKTKTTSHIFCHVPLTHTSNQTLSLPDLSQYKQTIQNFNYSQSNRMLTEKPYTSNTRSSSQWLMQMVVSSPRMAPPFIISQSEVHPKNRLNVPSFEWRFPGILQVSLDTPFGSSTTLIKLKM